MAPKFTKRNKWIFAEGKATHIREIFKCIYKIYTQSYIKSHLLFYAQLHFYRLFFSILQIHQIILALRKEKINKLRFFIVNFIFLQDETAS
jgi:hypothetical protein